MSLQFRNRFNKDFERIKVHIDKNEKIRTTTKIQKTTIDWVIDNYDFNRSYLVTLHLNDKLSFKKEIKDLVFNEISKINKRFIRRLENKVFSKNSNKRLEVFTVIEGLKFKTNRNHIHLIISTEKHMTREMMIVEIVRSFERTKYLVDIHIKKVEHDVTNLIDYLIKQLKVMTLDDDTIDFKNCYLNKTNYLKKKLKEGFILSRVENLMQDLNSANLVLGIASEALTQAYYMEKPVFSIILNKPGKVSANKMTPPVMRNNIINSIDECREMLSNPENWIFKKNKDLDRSILKIDKIQGNLFHTIIKNLQ